MSERAVSGEYSSRSLTLLVFGILGVSCALIATLWFSVETLIARATADKIASENRENMNLARAFEEHTGRTLAEVDRVLMAITERFEEKGELLNLPGLWMDIHPDLAISSNSIVTDAAGTVILASGPLEPVSLADREHINIHFQHDSSLAFIGKPIEARIIRQWSIPLTRRANNPDGSLKGVVALAVNPSYFSNFYREIDIGQAGFVSLNGLDGIVRSRLSQGPLRLGADVSAGTVFKQATTTPFGAMITRSTLDGIERIMAFRTVRGYPLYVVVGTSLDEALAEVRARGIHDRISASVATALILLVAAGLLEAARNVHKSRAELFAAKNAAESASKFLRSLADNLPVSIAYIDKERRIRFVNRTTEIWHAKPRAQLLGRTSDETGWRYPDMPTKGMARKGHLVRDEYPVHYPDGVIRWVDVIRSPHFGEHGDVLGHFRLVVDITERKRMDEKLRQAQRMEAIGNMTGGIAHDFNNLLAVVLGNLELMERAGLNEKCQRLLQPAVRAVGRGADLVRQLLAFGRRQNLRPVPTRLAALLPSLRDMMARTLGETIAWEWDIAADLDPCLIDPAQLESAILNLSINARDAMPEGGKIVVRAYNATLNADFAARHPDVPVGRYVAVAVTDSGHGMTPEVQARAFEPFFTTKDVEQGSGLGLSMVHGFVKQSGGGVTIDSAPGQGTTVTLYLPQTELSGPVGESREARPAKVSFSATVLIVEDQDDVRELAGEQFEHLGFRVLLAVDSREALDHLSAHAGDIDLLFSDVVLGGGMNGPELAVAAKRLRPDIKVLFASGYVDGTRGAGRGLDADAYLLHKPYKQAVLVQALLDMLGAAPTESPPADSPPGRVAAEGAFQGRG